MTLGKFFAIWAAVGPLVGVVVGGFLTAWWQRRQWILDNKAREYREALDALEAYRRNLLNLLATQAYVPISRNTSEAATALGQSQVHLDNVLVDRIFTLDAVARSGVRDDLMRFYQSQNSATPPTVTQSTQTMADLHLKLLETAVTDLKLKRVPRK
ncbi:MAG TPA: hypothetical protein VEO19_13255 [Terriglobia bacterium]|nr:hypothetical protein [Terriglobia bacterium]